MSAREFQPLPESTERLLHYLNALPHEAFHVHGRVDGRGFLGRAFPSELPLLISLQRYPGYQRMIGENWLHWHDYFEFFVALSGKGHFRCGHDLFHFHTGDVVVVDPLKIHGVWQMDPTHSALVILFPRHLITGSQHSSCMEQGLLTPWEQRAPGTLPLLSGLHPKTSLIHEAVYQLAQSWFSATLLGETRWLQLKLQLLNVLFQMRLAFPMAATVPLPDVQRARQEQRLRQALEYIAQHSHESLTQEDVAKSVGMSISRFRAFFKSTTGWGFLQYLRDQRVERAARLLRETNETVATIAHRTGFADQSHLLRCFKHKHRISPIAYRFHHHLGAQEEAG